MSIEISVIIVNIVQYIGYLGITGSFRIDPVICKEIKNRTGRRILYSYEGVLDRLPAEGLELFISLIREDNWDISNFSEGDTAQIKELVKLGLLVENKGVLNINQVILWKRPVPTVKTNLSNW